MATFESWQSATVADSLTASGGQSPRKRLRTSKLSMILDVFTVLGTGLTATVVLLHTDPVTVLTNFWHGTLIHGCSMSTLLVLLCGFIVALILTSRRMHLYAVTQLYGFLHEQRLTLQACFTSGLFLTGTLYLIHASNIPRSIVLGTLGLVMISLSLRRLVYRVMLNRRLDRGLGTRSVLIVGTGPEADVLRNQMEHIRHLGYKFKGFIEVPNTGSRFAAKRSEVVGTLDTMFEHARQHFVDEIFFTISCEQGVMQDTLEKARAQGIDLRVVPNMYDGLAWNSPIEFIGQFPTIPLHSGVVPEIALVLKSILDVVFSSVALTLLSPVLLAIAIAVKLDSRGPVFYSSERIGKRGRVFKCTKFRTMVSDAETRRAEIMHMNERDGILFKVTNDPRITRVGRFLRKYSLDELPQFFNVLRGEMSVVGPRPPLASEVREYKLSHLRRLDVMPGITGLWQVQGRSDPSFDSYVSLDVTYIETWSIWLDLKIILRTVAVVFAGTGS